MRDREQGGAEPSDLELVQRGRAGDEAALGALARRHHAAAYRVALSLVRQDDLAQQSERALAHTLMAQQSGHLAKLAFDYSFWNEAYQNVTIAPCAWLTVDAE